VNEAGFGDPRTCCSDAVLKDGTRISIRPVTALDRDHLACLFQQLSPRSIYFRFFRHKQRLSDAELHLFTELDFEKQAGLAVTIAGQDRIIAVGRYTVVSDSDPLRAEVNFAVADAWQGRGIGSALLKHLAAVARGYGIESFEAFVLPGNVPMMAVFHHSGFPVSLAAEEGVIHVTFPILGG